MKNFIVPALASLLLVPASAHAMQKGTVKFFNETKGFGFVQQGAPLDPTAEDAKLTAETIDLAALDARSCDSGTKTDFPIFNDSGSQGQNEIVTITFEAPPAGQKVWLPSNFKLEIEGISPNDKLVSKIDAIVYKQKNIRDDVGILRDSPLEPGTVEVAKECLPKSDQLNIWTSTVINGAVERKSISVCFHNDAGEESMRVNFFDCFPTRWRGPSLNAKNSGHATEKLELSCARHDAAMAAIQNTR